METKDIEKLKKLNNELILEGCINFHIIGISNNFPNDVFCLNLKNGKWQVNYTERGIDEKQIYSTYDLDDAINFYKNYIMNIEHWHLIIITKTKINLLNTRIFLKRMV
jgi:hypothetical protein